MSYKWYFSLVTTITFRAGSIISVITREFCLNVVTNVTKVPQREREIKRETERERQREGGRERERCEYIVYLIHTIDGVCA